MLDIKEETRGKLSSSDPGTRMAALLILWSDLRDKLRKYLQSKTKSPKDADDLLQETYERVLARLLDKPFLEKADGKLEGYLWTVAHHLLISKARRDQTEKTKTAEHVQLHMLNNSSSLEDQVMQRLDHETLRRLLLHLPNEWERKLAILYSEHSPQQISLLTGWNELDVRKGIRRIKRQLTEMWAQQDDYVNRFSQWEELISSSNTHAAFSISLIDIFPAQIAMECVEEMLKDYQVSDLRQLQERFTLMLRLDDINTHELRETLTITTRTSLGAALFEGEPIFYQDYIVHFDQERADGHWQQVAVLTKNQNEYHAQRVSTYYDDQANQFMSKWIFSPHNICVRKYLSEKEVHASLNPKKRVELVSLYQVRPLTEAESAQGLVCA